MLKYFLFVQILVFPILGKDTSIEDHPYIVSVQEFGGHLCGGTIISPSLIVSAAHCFKQLHNYTIRAGSSFQDEGGEVIVAKDIIIHESYNLSNRDYDIALIQLSNNITTPLARPIEFADEGEAPAEGTIVTVTGWAAIFEAGSWFDRLQSTDVPVVSLEECRDAYDGFQLPITDRMLCAINLEGPDTPFSEDSGSPLVVNGVLTGILSIGMQANIPAVFTSVPQVSSWIRKNARI